MKIVFMGTPDFAKFSLEAIYNAGHEIIAVVTNPDRPKGRGMKMIASPVKEFAIEKNIPVYQPIKIRNNIEFIEHIKSLNPEVICVVAYGKILPKEILDIPPKGCINVHGSLLPKYRGAAPIQWAVLNGDKKTGITTMYMDEGMDTGDMILKQEENYTMAPMLSKEMAKIDWKNQTARDIKNLVRGLNPIMGAYAYLNGKKIKFWKVDIANNIGMENPDFLKNGTVLISDKKDGIFIKTKEGILKVLEIQGENAKKMNIQDFLRGNDIPEFSLFE